jgi:hypothetical protein
MNSLKSITNYSTSQLGDADSKASAIFCVMTACDLVEGRPRPFIEICVFSLFLGPNDNGATVFLRNFGKHLADDTVS